MVKNNKEKFSREKIVIYKSLKNEIGVKVHFEFDKSKF